MQYSACYSSPLGEILLTADAIGLTGLWFSDQKYAPAALQPEEATSPVLEQAMLWLTQYFSRKEPTVSVPLHMMGTPFQVRVWQQLLKIPYGSTTTYGKIAAQLSVDRKMSAQAVGNAIGRNKISIIVPCHRVIGANGELTGYAGGLDRKQYLLTQEASIPI